MGSRPKVLAGAPARREAIAAARVNWGAGCTRFYADGNTMAAGDDVANAVLSIAAGIPARDRGAWLRYVAGRLAA